MHYIFSLLFINEFCFIPNAECFRIEYFVSVKNCSRTYKLLCMTCNSYTLNKKKKTPGSCLPNSVAFEYAIDTMRNEKKESFCHMRITKANISVCRRAVWSGPPLFVNTSIFYSIHCFFDMTKKIMIRQRIRTGWHRPLFPAYDTRVIFWHWMSYFACRMCSN